MTASEAFRTKLASLTDADLAKRLYLCGLVCRIESELLAFMTLCGDGDEPLTLTPPPDARLSAMQHMMMQEIKRRGAATTKRQREGESAHAQQNSRRN